MQPNPEVLAGVAPLLRVELRAVIERHRHEPRVRVHGDEREPVLPLRGSRRGFGGSESRLATAERQKTKHRGHPRRRPRAGVHSATSLEEARALDVEGRFRANADVLERRGRSRLGNAPACRPSRSLCPKPVQGAPEAPPPPAAAPPRSRPGCRRGISFPYRGRSTPRIRRRLRRGREGSATGSDRARGARKHSQTRPPWREARRARDAPEVSALIRPSRRELKLLNTSSTVRGASMSGESRGRSRRAKCAVARSR